MKAKEYLDKYRSLIQEAIDSKQAKILDKIGIDILIEFSNEAGKIMRDRKITRNESAGAVMIELNQKWNALGRLIEAEFGFPFLKIDGFIKYWNTRIPELTSYMTKRKNLN